MSLMLRNQYDGLFTADALPVLEELFFDSYSQHPMVRDMIFKRETSDRDIAQFLEMHDLELFTEVEEGEDFTFSRPKQGASKTYVMAKFGGGYRITEEMVADGKFSIIAELNKKLAESGKETQEIAAMNVLNNGTTTETTADGVALFSTAHTLPSGGTFSNKTSVDASLSKTALKEAIAAFRQTFIGDSGIIKNIKARTLLVHEDLRLDAKELIGSDLTPDSADNNMNSIKGEGLRVVSSPHLSSSTFWALVADPADTGLRYYSRQPMAMSSDEQFDNDTVKVKAKYREALGASHGKGIYLGSS